MGRLGGATGENATVRNWYSMGWRGADVFLPWYETFIAPLVRSRIMFLVVFFFFFVFLFPSFLVALSLML